MLMDRGNPFMRRRVVSALFLFLATCVPPDAQAPALDALRAAYPGAAPWIPTHGLAPTAAMQAGLRVYRFTRAEATHDVAQAAVWRSAATQLSVELPSRADGALLLEDPRSGFRLVAHRVDAGAGGAEPDGSALVYRQAFPFVDAYLYASGDGVEELLHVNRPAKMAWDLSLPPGARLRAEGTTVDLVDASGVTRLRFSAPFAFGRDNRTVLPEVSVAGTRISLALPDDAQYPVLVDPIWNSSGSMAGARTDHTAIALPNGKVLIAGGQANGTALASAQLYDPGTGTFSAAAPMASARYLHTAVYLPSVDMVLVAGGLDSSLNVLASAELYDVKLNVWKPTGTMGTGRYAHGCVRTTPDLPEAVFCFGGVDGGGNQLASVERLVGNVWDHATAPMPLARSFFTATTFYNTSSSDVMAAIVGGETSTGITGRVDLFDLATRTWGATVNLATARRGHTTTWLGSDEMIVAGGQDPAGTPLASTERLMVNGTVQPGPNMLSTRIFHAAVLLPDRRVLVIGGFANPGCSSCNPGLGTCPSSPVLPACGGAAPPSAGDIAGTELYNGTFWSAPANTMSIDREQHTATMLPSGRVLVTGGTTQGVATAKAEEFDPLSGSWTSLMTQKLLTGRSNATATFMTNLSPVLVTNEILIAGGLDVNNVRLASGELFDSDIPGWAIAATGPMTQPRSDHTATQLYDGTVLIVGGTATSAPPETYNLATNTFTATASTFPALQDHTATLLPNGQVLITGGRLGVGAPPQQLAYLYDPITRVTSTLAATLKVARAQATATLLPNGMVLIAGGLSDLTRNTCPSCQPMLGLPTPACAPVAPCVGFPSCPPCGTFMSLDPSCQPDPANPSCYVPGDVGPESTTELYDPASLTFTLSGSMLQPAGGQTATLVPSGRVALVGGDAFGCQSFCQTPLSPQGCPIPQPFEMNCPQGMVPQLVPQTIVQQYDPSSGAFVSSGILSEPRDQHTTTLLATGQLLVSGGTTISCAQGPPGAQCNPGPPCQANALPSCNLPAVITMPSTSAEVFDPRLPISPLSFTGITSHVKAAAAMQRRGEVVVFGGAVGSNLVDQYKVGYLGNGDGSLIDTPLGITAGRRTHFGGATGSALGGSGGNGTQDSAGNYPTYFLMHLDGGGLFFGSSTSDLTTGGVGGFYTPPVTTVPGAAVLFMAVGGATVFSPRPIMVCPPNTVLCSGACLTGECCTAADCTNPGVCQTTTGASCSGNACTYPTASNGTSCASSNPCQTGTTCQSGACQGGSTITCTALDTCHTAGVCNPATGVCSNPNASDGTSCGTGNACVSGETCQAGVCQGGLGTICPPPPDPCHMPGFCDPSNGTCSNPPVPDGFMCASSNLCIIAASCMGGTCTGGVTKICPAADQCHLAGLCDPATGNCSNPPIADGTACNDGDACTQTDVCQAGTCAGTPKTCAGGDACNIASCNPGTGACSLQPQPNGTSCTTGGLCVTGQSCQAGACLGGTPVVCTALDQCHTAGTCNPASGVCSNPTKADGVACSDGNACTQTDSCQTGTCIGANPTICTAIDQCHDPGTCAPATGLCSNPTKANGAACNDGNACTQSDTCQAGTCTSGTAVVCSALDQCHDPGTCNVATGTCSNPNKANGSACSDGNACTQTDSCQAGSCSGANPVTCPAPDQCHNAGTCNTTTGACSNPAKVDGTACNDTNACTQTDTCQAGACTGSNPVICNASDQCHVAGVCNMGTGACSNPTKADGAACNDANACTQSDTCQAGACTGANPVSCPAPDQCHNAGVCNTMTGACSNPAKMDGTGCSDGNACTQTDTCQTGTCTGGNPVTCTALDQCHDPGICAPATGVCSNPNKSNGSACSDGNSCTQTDTCQTGTCTGGNPVTCTALDQCHDPGTCAPATGVCSNPVKADGAACNDGNACSQSDTCQAGVCAGSNPVVCPAPDQCHTLGVCNTATGVCSNPAKVNGTACDDTNACTQSDTCQVGVCTGGSPVLCSALDQCHAPGTCAPATGVCSNPNKADGAACNDANACTQSDTCQAGACTGSNPVLCGAPDQCHNAGVCNTMTGACSNPAKMDGTSCNDTNACTQTDTCQAGTCAGSNPIVCGALDQCHLAGSCAPATGVCSNPNKADGAACSDGNACTQSDTCQTGVCAGSNPVVCGALDQCHDPGTCAPATGVCSNPNKSNGAACNDGNACTQTDSCQAGTCTGSNGIVCTPLDQCHDPGTCNTVTGACTNPSKVNGSACNDGSACTQTDTCLGGTCTGGNPVVCGALDQCHVAGTCNAATGACSNPNKANGAGCDDGNACTMGDSCQAGTCSGGSPVVCTAADACHVVGVCNAASGVCSNPPAPTGTSCSDGNLCTTNDLCDGAGACSVSTPVSCPATDQCHNPGSCNAANGLCSNPPKLDGSVCNDGSACTTSDTCQAGVCTGGSGTVCQPVDQCHSAGVCNGASGSCSNPALPLGTTCDDGDPCTFNDQCTATGCRGTSITCTSDACTVRSCNNSATCLATPRAAGVACDDGNTCTFNDLCNGSGTCVGTTLSCNSDSCATRACNGSASCTVTPVLDGTACGGTGNLCLSGGTCQTGVCSGMTLVTCMPLDTCHVAGTCDPSSGACSNPPIGNGSTCDDGDLCTFNDQCTAGLCHGTAITCTDDACNTRACDGSASCQVTPHAAGVACDDTQPCTFNDQCNGMGTCVGTLLVCASDTCATRSCNGGPSCTVMPAVNGTSCGGGANKCIGPGTCGGGTCSGTTMVSCGALDQCHVAGTCDPASGACSNPQKLDGTTCDDGDPCTLNDQCTGGGCRGTPMACQPLDQCHDAGVCSSLNGLCSNPVKPMGVGCDDSNPCTTNDTCGPAGACAGAPITCTQLDQCHLVGACNPATGLCVNPPAMNGLACNDGSLCTGGETCQNGTCTPATVVTCMAFDQCHDAGMCNPATGMCSNPDKLDGAACTTGNLCVSGESCTMGFCSGGTAAVCNALDQCHAAGQCDPLSGACSNPMLTNGSACDDGDRCTTGESCQTGVCGAPTGTITCSALDQCHDAGTCNSATGACSTPIKSDGASCDDGNLCTDTDTCTQGVCGGQKKVCPGETACSTSSCEAATGQCSPTVPKAVGTHCDDGDGCTSGDTCRAGGGCQGSSITCDTPPDPQCATTAGTCTAGACVYPPTPGIACDDGDARTRDDTCGPDGRCHGTPVDGAGSDLGALPSVGGTAGTGCSCDVGGGRANGSSATLLFLLGMLGWWARRRRRLR